MHYRLVSRDNVESDILESWPPVLNPSFTLYNNKIIDIIFPNEIQIFNWLGSRSRSKTAKMTNTQSPRNGDPNKLYAVYLCMEPGDPSYDSSVPPSYMYSVKMIRPGEAQPVIITKTNERIKTSFKKFNIRKVDLFDRMDLSDPSAIGGDDSRQLTPEGEVVHSSDIRHVNFKFFEGIYPISKELGVESDGEGGEGNVQIVGPNDAAVTETRIPNTNGIVARRDFTRDYDYDVENLDRVKGSDESSQDNSSDALIDTDAQNFQEGFGQQSILDSLNRPHIKKIATVRQPKPEPIKMITRTERQQRNDDFMGFVRAIHTMDSQQNRSSAGAEYDVIFSDPSDKWLDHFCDKLEQVEKYLRFLAIGGRGQFHLRYHRGLGTYIQSNDQYEIKRKSLIEEIHSILEANRDLTKETSDDFLRISNLVTDPLLFDGNLYQVRYDETLMTWHAQYSRIIRELRVIPSKQFCIFIIAFDLSDFFAQKQSVDVLEELHHRMSELYYVPERRKVKFLRKTPNVKRVTRSF